jgi:tetratricopeptide (TPR) repeat protein
LAEQCYAGAYQALENGDPANAQGLFLLMALLVPRDERPWIGLAVARERLGDWLRAAGLYQMGSALAPASAWCHFGRGRALKRMGRFRQAERSFDHAEELAESRLLRAAIADERNAP